MNNDIESDYWKDIFRHLQHRNMSRIQAERLSFQDAMPEIQQFVEKHREINFLVENQGSYITFEAPVTQTINVRLFIQNQIKASLMQKNGNDFVKIADCKFFNNPFPEIELLLENRERYEQELLKEKGSKASESAKSKITCELIKALLIKKFGKEGWSVVSCGDNFKIDITINSEKKQLSVSENDFVDEVKKL